VLVLMTRSAQRQAVRHVEPHFGVGGPPAHVVGVQLSSASTMSAPPFVASLDGLPPLVIGVTVPPVIDVRRSAFPGAVIRSALMRSRHATLAGRDAGGVFGGLRLAHEGGAQPGAMTTGKRSTPVGCEQGRGLCGVHCLAAVRRGHLRSGLGRKGRAAAVVPTDEAHRSALHSARGAACSAGDGGALPAAAFTEHGTFYQISRAA
jgi:hypothetical protein